jgi:ribosomal protein S18 acetylase RimI-like enzyme
MAVPRQIRAFLYEMESLAETCLRTPWGTVITDSRYPLIYDANHAAVLEPSPSLTLAEIRAALLPALRRAGASHEHIEFVDIDEPPRARDELARELGHASHDVLMVYEGPHAEPRTDAVVDEMREPDEAFWTVYRETRDDFGETFRAEVVDQLVARDREVSVPAGLRIFAGTIGGKVAGFTSLLSFGGTGYIDNVVTRPPFRRRGVASATVTRAVESALAGGDTAVFLFAEDGGKPQGLYERLGFRVQAKAIGFTQPLAPA